MDLARNLIGRINVGDSLTRTAAARPGQLAVVDGERRLSYADFNSYVNRLAGSTRATLAGSATTACCGSPTGTRT